MFVAPTLEVLGLRGAAVTAQTHVTRDPDVTLRELGKYAASALRANPTMLELPWPARREVRDAFGAALVGARHAFSSREAVCDAYDGHAVQQARRLPAHWPTTGPGTRRPTGGRAVPSWAVSACGGRGAAGSCSPPAS